MKTFIVLSFGLLFLAGCGAPAKNDTSSIDIAATNLTDHPGYKLYQMYCISCHGITTEPGKRLAPPAFMVQNHYKNAFDEKEFKQRIIDWVPNTSKEKSMMPGAIRNFDLMPPIALSLKDRQQIADYFWETTFDEPAWATSPGLRGRGRMGMMQDSLAIDKPAQ